MRTVSTLQRVSALFLLTISFCIISLRPAYAVPPDINGTYSITGSGTLNCPGPVSTPESITITQTTTQTGNSFTGSGNGTSTSSFGTATFTVNYSGTIADNGSYSGTVTGSTSFGDSFNATFTGTASADGSSFTQTVMTNFTPSGCNNSWSGTGTRTSGGGAVVITEETPSNVLTNVLLLNTQVNAITTGLNSHITDALRGLVIGFKPTTTGFMWQDHTSGLNAGDAITGYGLWGSFSYADFDNDFAATAFDGHRFNLLAGIDISPWENSLAGIAVGYEGSNIDTTFNGGNQDTDGFTIAPYFGYLLSDNFSIDASAGYSSISSDQYRTDPVTTARVTSDPDSDRWFVAANASVFTTYGNWIFSGRTGILYTRNTTDLFVESDGTVIQEFTSKLGQINVGGEAAYSYGEFEPFARVAYEYDYTLTEISVSGAGPQPSNDTDNFLFGAGLRYYGANGLSGNLEWNKRVGRDNFDEDTFTATLRMDF